MITQILFPYDFSAQCLSAVPSVHALATQLRAGVTLLSVAPLDAAVTPSSGQGDVAMRIRTLRSRLDQALCSEFADVPVERMAVAGDPGSCITDVAHARGVDLIMMPTHGLGLFRALVIGSATSKVLHDARCPVWTAAHVEAQGAGGLPKVIVCAVDRGLDGGALIQWAEDLSTRIGARLKVLHVVSPVTTDWPLEHELKLQEQAYQAARAEIVSLQAAVGVHAPLRVVVGDIVATVAECAREEEADLVLIGRGSLQGPLGRLRTHAYGIIQRSPCPVLSV